MPGISGFAEENIIVCFWDTHATCESWEELVSTFIGGLSKSTEVGYFLNIKQQSARKCLGVPEENDREYRTVPGSVGGIKEKKKMGGSGTEGDSNLGKCSQCSD